MLNETSLNESSVREALKAFIEKELGFGITLVKVKQDQVGDNRDGFATITKVTWQRRV